MLAAYVAGGQAKKVPELMAALKITPKSSFEVAFNRACGLVEVGDLAGAETALRMAIKQGEGAGWRPRRGGVWGGVGGERVPASFAAGGVGSCAGALGTR
jgi:hypothetical protein